MTIPTQVYELKILTVATPPFDPISLTSPQGALYFLNAADLRVRYRNALGVEVAWTLGVDYSIAGAGSVGEGQLTPISATEAGGQLCIWRETPLIQDADYEENDGFPAQTHERVADKDMLINQDLKRQLDKAIRVCDCDPPINPLPCAADRADKCLHFDENGQPVMVDCSTNNLFQVEHTIENYGVVIPPGVSGEGHIDFPCEVIGWVVYTKEQGSIKFDARIKPYAENAPAGAGNTITAGAGPELVNSRYKRHTDIPTWTKTVAGASSVEWSVVSCSGITRAYVALLVRRTFG